MRNRTSKPREEKKEEKMKSIVIIPARGGSKGIPRKNLRPLRGKPLISYAIQAALDSEKVGRVVVSTEDEEIALFAERFGAEVIKRPENLAGDDVTLDPVVVHAVESAENRWGEVYDAVVTVQPTCPFVTGGDIDQAIEKLAAEGADTLLTAHEDRHLRWKEEGGRIVPDYEKRLNRQLLPPCYRETGVINACTRKQLRTGTRVGEKISLMVLDEIKSIDIDTYHDFWVAEMILKRKRIVFTVTGNAETGLGHAYRAVMLAHEFIQHDIVFVCTEEDDLAENYISEQNYPVVVTERARFLDTVLSLGPDMVINDILDTGADYIWSLKKAGIKVVNFEDLGLGAEIADLVINALYPYRFPYEHFRVGPKYFCLRDEFLHLSQRERKGPVGSILVAFGGVDEGNLTCRVLEVLSGLLQKNRVDVHVIVGPGYRHHEELRKLLDRLDSKFIHYANATRKISEYMTAADMAITSAGRTVLELASIGVPTIVIAQNSRETRHTVASGDNGIINLGHRKDVTDDVIREAVERLMEDEALRARMRDRMLRMGISDGKRTVIQEINALLEQGAEGK
ncbi:MAG: NTP transferase domain-containing protein [Deltaproteobacteria bacterium]|nr:NTP transferase domain-containing protein [Deltaproteobacteria bacterium]MBW2130677.1 NTP transferase domain-containing protein [Deltaproteobacteria bacterium]